MFKRNCVFKLSAISKMLSPKKITLYSSLISMKFGHQKNVFALSKLIMNMDKKMYLKNFFEMIISVFRNIKDACKKCVQFKLLQY